MRASFPPARFWTIEALNAGGEVDSRWVETEGVVRSAADNDGRVQLTVNGTDTLAVLLRDHRPSASDQLPDTRIRIRGVCGSNLDSRGKRAGALVFVPSEDYIEVLDRHKHDPFGEPSVLAADIPKLAGKERLRRLHITGTVTFLKPRALPLKCRRCAHSSDASGSCWPRTTR